MSRRLVMCIASALAFAQPARAGFLDRVTDKVTDKVVRKTEDTASKAVDDAMKSKPKEAPKQSADKQVERKAAAPIEAADDRLPPAKRDGQAAAAEAAPAPGEVYGNRFDFVPGDKVLVYDDFSDTDVGEFPAKWTLKEGGGGNAVEVVEVGKRRFLKSRYLKGHQQNAIQWLRYEIKGDMPKNFTIEFDADLAGGYGVLFNKTPNWGGQVVVFNDNGYGEVRSENVRGTLPTKVGIQHVALAVSGTQVKVYVSGERVLADPDAVKRPIKRLGVEFWHPHGEEGLGDHQMFTGYRLAEGGKSAKTMLAGEGRIVTHGILFDSGSNVIKPESGPTLRAIHALLVEDAALRFSIEGHTDDQGGPKVNGPLSERRAAAVKAWLVKQGVDASRLASKGLGQTKPIDTNDTAEGRANNRRVEFVRAGSTT